MTQRAFGRLLAQWIQRKGLTRRAAAAACGVSASYLSSIISGSRRPPMDDRLRAIHTAIGEGHYGHCVLLAHLANSPEPIEALIMSREATSCAS